MWLPEITAVGIPWLLASLAAFSLVAMPPVPRVEEITPAVEELAVGAGSNRGTGGMATKLNAAKLAKSHGIPTAVISGSHTETLYQLLRGEDVGTVFPV